MLQLKQSLTTQFTNFKYYASNVEEKNFNERFTHLFLLKVLVLLSDFEIFFDNIIKNTRIHNTPETSKINQN